jgi:hypothetical protein
MWWQLSAKARMKRGGYIESKAQYVETLPFPVMTPSAYAHLAALRQAWTDTALLAFNATSLPAFRQSSKSRGATARAMSEPPHRFVTRLGDFEQEPAEGGETGGPEKHDGNRHPLSLLCRKSRVASNDFLKSRV